MITVSSVDQLLNPDQLSVMAIRLQLSRNLFFRIHLYGSIHRVIIFLTAVKMCKRDIRHGGNSTWKKTLSRKKVADNGRK